MNIREEYPTDDLGRIRNDIVEYYFINEKIATLVKPRMILTIGPFSYRVKDKEDIANHIKKYYFKEI
tara:strand:+ start:357 stop:557 length:201 start_codon:yes stop_codon:yes gene_type:complete